MSDVGIPLAQFGGTTIPERREEQLPEATAQRSADPWSVALRQGEYFLEADEPGRDVMVRLL
jgi:hypothetical protein